MLPFLKYIADGKEHSLSETHDALAVEFKLTLDELRELLPSGRHLFLEIESVGPEPISIKQV